MLINNKMKSFKQFVNKAPMHPDASTDYAAQELKDIKQSFAGNQEQDKITYNDFVEVRRVLTKLGISADDVVTKQDEMQIIIDLSKLNPPKIDIESLFDLMTDLSSFDVDINGNSLIMTKDSGLGD